MMKYKGFLEVKIIVFSEEGVIQAMEFPSEALFNFFLVASNKILLKWSFFIEPGLDGRGQNQKS